MKIKFHKQYMVLWWWNELSISVQQERGLLALRPFSSVLIFYTLKKIHFYSAPSFTNRLLLLCCQWQTWLFTKCPYKQIDINPSELLWLILLTDLFHSPGSHQTPMPLPPPQPFQPTRGLGNGSVAVDSAHSTNQVLNYLESQVHGMDATSPLIQHQSSVPRHQMPPPPQQMPRNVPFSAGPPSMLSALDDGPPAHRPPRPHDHYNSSSGNHGDRPHYPMSCSYSQEDVLSDGGRRGNPNERAGYRPRSRSRDDLFRSDPRHSAPRQDRRYSPPQAGRRGSWSSANDQESRRGGARGGDWENPPTYSEYEPGQKPAKRYDRYSVRK